MAAAVSGWLRPGQGLQSEKMGGGREGQTLQTRKRGGGAPSLSAPRTGGPSRIGSRGEEGSGKVYRGKAWHLGRMEKLKARFGCPAAAGRDACSQALTPAESSQVAVGVGQSNKGEGGGEEVVEGGVEDGGRGEGAEEGGQWGVRRVGAGEGARQGPGRVGSRLGWGARQPPASRRGRTYPRLPRS